jgi:AraC-like DNA-binding protein
MRSLLIVLSVLGAVQCAILAVGFAGSRSTAHRLFVLLASALVIILSGAAVLESEWVHAAPHLARVHVPFNYLLAPLVYCFVRASLDRPLPRLAWLHALPAVACAVWLMPFYASSAGEKLRALTLPPGDATIRLGLLILQGAVYLMLTFRLLAAHDRGRVQRRLWIGTALTMLLWSGAAVRLVTGISALWVPAAFAVVATVILMTIVRAHGAARQEGRPKYARSTLTDERSEHYLRRLIEFFERDKPYLETALSLDDVARKSRIPTHHLSQIVNQRLGANFNDWVNGYRVEEAQARLRSARFAHLSIVAIAEESGFASKSTFNAAFRKATGMTPSEYRRRPKSAEETSGITKPDVAEVRSSST